MPKNSWAAAVKAARNNIICMRYNFILLAGMLVLAAFVGVGHSETFKDEAGRVIYIIDENGIVSMFENSPGIDITLSVTRGTIEEMKPQVTEVTPESVTAGTNALLKLKGKNLVGATVKLSVPSIEVEGYAGKPTSLDVPLRIPTNVPPGPVSVEVRTPIGNTKANFKVTEVKIGGGAPVRRETPVEQAVSTAAPASCPEGMVGVGAERGGFCIETDRTFTAEYRKAEKTCSVSGRRLCQAAEWRTACQEAALGKLPMKNMPGEWEWTGTEAIKEVPGQSTDYGGTGELRSILLGRSDCQSEREYQTWRSEIIAGRCCK
jgi:hypothetical protein